MRVLWQLDRCCQHDNVSYCVCVTLNSFLYRALSEISHGCMLLAFSFKSITGNNRTGTNGRLKSTVCPVQKSFRIAGTVRSKVHDILS